MKSARGLKYKKKKVKKKVKKKKDKDRSSLESVNLKSNEEEYDMVTEAKTKKKKDKKKKTKKSKRKKNTIKRTKKKQTKRTIKKKTRGGGVINFTKKLIGRAPQDASILTENDVEFVSDKYDGGFIPGAGGPPLSSSRAPSPRQKHGVALQNRIDLIMAERRLSASEGGVGGGLVDNIRRKIPGSRRGELSGQDLREIKQKLHESKKARNWTDMANRIYDDSDSAQPPGVTRRSRKIDKEDLPQRWDIPQKNLNREEFVRQILESLDTKASFGAPGLADIRNNEISKNNITPEEISTYGEYVRAQRINK